MRAPKEVIELIERFRTHLNSYHAPAYKEAHVRQEFLNPLISALGWDIANQRGYDEAYKEVIHEDTVTVEGARKAPDYSFSIGGKLLFYFEAKKPSVDLKEDAAAAYQLRRYAWSAGLPVSLLTNFEEFAVYQGHPVLPDPSDKASTARVVYFTVDDLAEHWEKLCDLFSRDAVVKGSFDRFAKGPKGKRGTAAVDDAFLLEIEKWRDVLARNFALRNSRLTEGDLNAAVQRTIDRIVFLRICEDRGIERYGRLQATLGKAGIYGRLTALFREADQRYNSGLFHFEREPGRPEHHDDFTLKLEVDDEPLSQIVRSLYFPESPYEFSVISGEILGKVYEQFLGKTIRLTPAHRAVVETKPEVRKAGGVYYTPAHIVNHIVERTLGPLVKGKTKAQVAKLRVLDPACGSGSFLVGAYRFLLKWHRDLYLRNPKRFRKELVGTKLATAERKRILKNSIFGVDIDRQAVEVTKLSLLLAVMEGETQQTLDHQLRLFHERALPDLGDNIKHGNSLIGTDYRDTPDLGALSGEERTAINAFDYASEFKAGDFDAVIGNPPYDVMEKERNASSWPHWMLARYVRVHPEYEAALGGKLNLFRFFIVRSLQLTRQGGRFGMILPLALLADVSCASTRKHLMLSSKHLVASCFPQKDNAARRVFRDAKLSTAIITCMRHPVAKTESARIEVNVYPWDSFDDAPRTSNVAYRDAALLDPENLPIPLVNEEEWVLCRRVHRAAGVIRLGDESAFSITRGEINQTIYRKYITDDGRMARLLKGVEVRRFGLNVKLKQGRREWFDEKAFLKDFPDGRPVSRLQRIATQRITGVDERVRVVAALVEPTYYFADSTNSIVVRPGTKYRAEYLLGLLNSKLFQWRFRLTSTNNNVGTNELESLPFRQINFAIANQKTAHDRLVELVERLTDLLHKRRTTKGAEAIEQLERLIEGTDRLIDEHVLALYSLPKTVLPALDRPQPSPEGGGNS